MRKGLALALSLCVALAVAGAALAAPRKVPRPTFRHPATVIESPYVALHYTKLGDNRPPLTDDDRDGVPNYVEKAAGSANKAWLFYGHNGFKAPLADTGGGSPKVDIYIARLPKGLLGVTIPASKTEQGAFMIVSNRLTLAHRAMQGSLQQTVAHELFHLWQLSYVPSGALPGWAIEGSATAMETYVYPQIADPVRFDYVDHWLDQPWRSLYDERAGCDHCYGGALWWRFVFHLGNHVLPEYFGRLYGYAKTAQPTGDGTQPLDEVITKQTNGKENLFTAFSRFSYDIYRAGYRPAPFTRLTASTQLASTPVKVVRGLSTHYIPIAVPPGAKGVAVAVAAAGGPNPDVKLIVGGAKGRGIDRIVRADGHEQFFEATFANAAEAQKVMLIVTSGRREGAAYMVAYQAL
jgi:hypothetical protein